MASLTGNFLENRTKQNRFKKLFLTIGIFGILTAFVLTGFYLFDKSEQVDDKAGNQVASASTSTLPKDWLLKYFFIDNENDPAVGGPQGDPDGDVLKNVDEFYFGTDPTNPDTDGDGQYDGVELAINLNPLGEGELYSTDIAKQVANRYIDANNMADFKEENIRKMVFDLLNPPEAEAVEIPLPDKNTIVVSNNNSSEAAQKYISEANAAAGGLVYDEENVTKAFENPGDVRNAVNTGAVYDAVNRLRKISVPSDFLYFHQLQIAGLFAASSILEVASTVDPLVTDLESQQPKIQEQYYQIEVISKIAVELQNEITKLKQKYPNVF